MFDWSACANCDFNVCGRGSEDCSAVVGDFCPAANAIIEETEEDKNFLKKMLDKSRNL